jgi:hypothetical protein
MLVSRLGPAESVMDDSRVCLVPERLRHMERPSLWKTLPWLMDASVIPLKCSSSKFKDEAIGARVEFCVDMRRVRSTPDIEFVTRSLLATPIASRYSRRLRNESFYSCVYAPRLHCTPSHANPV